MVVHEDNFRHNGAIFRVTLKSTMAKLRTEHSSEEDFKKNIRDMEEIWQFRYWWAAIDGCHIPIKCPAGSLKSCKEYHNFKNFYSIVMMAMVDSNCRFIWGTCGFPGNSHDAIIFQSTQMWSDIKEGKFIPQIAKNINGVLVPPLVVGDSAFPFQQWLMKPYSNAVLTPKQGTLTTASVGQEWLLKNVMVN